MGFLFLDLAAVRATSALSAGLPLCRTAFPFADLSDHEVQTAARLWEEFPEKRGRLTDAVLASSGFPVKRPLDVTVLESHIDINDASPQLRAELGELGFEPDDFHRLHPECYVRHFTLQFFVPTSNPRRRGELRQELVERSRRALEVLRKHPSFYGYMELEIYGRQCIHKAQPGPLPTETVTQVIKVLSNHRYVKWEISNEWACSDGDLPFTTIKAADLHLKLRTHGPLDSTESDAATRQLVDVLLQAQFYEIVSEAGNSIFTAQFLKPSLAKALYAQLQAVIASTAAPVGICWEPCIGFIRFGLVPSGPDKGPLPPVPPVLVPVQPALLEA